MVAKINKFCLVISCKISHLGMNPVRGGSPPRESRVNIVIMINNCDLVDEIAIELIFVVLFRLNKRNMEEVIII